MGRGARAVAQLEQESGPKVTLTFRSEIPQQQELSKVLSEELRASKVPGRKGPTLSKVIEYVVSLGLDLYWARHEVGDQLEAFEAEHRLDRRATLVEVLRRGLKGKK